MQVTLFGGTFDPPHLGHQRIARAVIDQHLAAEVWYLPVGEHAFDKQFASAQHRCAMLELMLEPHQRIERFELEQHGMSITYDTLKALAKQYPQHTFSFVIGSDNLPRFHEWHHYRLMLEHFPFFIYPRQGFPAEPLYPGMQVLQHVPPVTISSSEIRQRLAAGEAITDLVTPAVAEYIHKNRVYM